MDTLIDLGNMPVLEPQGKSNEWYTPARYIEAARRVMGGIDLDPASCEMANRTVKAERYYTKRDNGLVQEWSGRVWLNPPFSDELTSKGFAGAQQGMSEIFVDRLTREYHAGNVEQAVLLVNAKHDIKWFQSLWEFPICFADHKVRFLRPKTGFESHMLQCSFISVPTNKPSSVNLASSAQSPNV